MAMNFFQGAQGSAMTALTGGVVNYGVGIAQANVGFLNKNPWIMPAALFLTGHALRKGKSAAVGNALLTLGGVSAVNAVVASGMLPAPGALLGGATAKGYGYGDAGILLDPSDVRQLSMGAQGYGYDDAGVVLQPVASAEAMGL